MLGYWSNARRGDPPILLNATTTSTGRACRIVILRQLVSPVTLHNTVQYGTVIAWIYAWFFLIQWSGLVLSHSALARQICYLTCLQVHMCKCIAPQRYRRTGREENHLTSPRNGCIGDTIQRKQKEPCSIEFVRVCCAYGSQAERSPSSEELLL